jgi:hypothetical protein
MIERRQAQTAVLLAITAAWALCASGCRTPGLDPDELRADLDFIFQTIRQTHPNPYAYISKAGLADLHSAAAARIDGPMTPAQFYWLTAPAVAAIRSGHTFLRRPSEKFLTYKQLGGAVYPIAIRLAGDKVILADVLSPPPMPIGGQILTIDGQGAMDFLMPLARCMPDEGRDAAPALLQRPQMLQLLLWLSQGGKRPLKLRVRDAAGQEDDYLLPPLHSNEISRRQAERNHKWQWLPYSCRLVDDPNAAVVTIDSFTDQHWYVLFLGDMLRQLREGKPTDLIIDLRHNRGGSVLLAELLLGLVTDKPFKLYEKVTVKLPNGNEASMSMPEITPAKGPRLFPGQLYVLIGPGTASSAVAFASAVKHYRIGTLIGEQTGGPGAVYGNPHRFRLPNSGLWLQVATNHAIVVGSAPDQRIQPHHQVKQTPQDAARNIDTALQFTLDLIRRNADPKRR